jgi:hypothetical protein
MTNKTKQTKSQVKQFGLTENEILAQKLAAPFTTFLEDGTEVPSINWRQLGKHFKKGDKFFVEYTPYLTAIQIIERINEVFPEQWNCTYEEMRSGNALNCCLEINGSMRSGIGTAFKKPDDIDKDKTMESDSIKRAALKYGIGSYLKDMKGVHLQVEIVSNKVEFAYMEDGKTKLHTPHDVNCYINGVKPIKLALSKAIKELDPKLQQENKDAIVTVWDLLK